MEGPSKERSQSPSRSFPLSWEAPLAVATLVLLPSVVCLLYWPGYWIQVIRFPIILSAKVLKPLPAVANLFSFFPQGKHENQRPKQDKKWKKKIVARVSLHTDLRDQERKTGWLRPRPERHVAPPPCRHRLSNSNAEDTWRAASSSHPEPVCLEYYSSEPDKLRHREKKHPFWQLFWQGSNSASFPGMFFFFWSLYSPFHIRALSPQCARSLWALLYAFWTSCVGTDFIKNVYSPRLSCTPPPKCWLTAWPLEPKHNFEEQQYA